MSGWSLSQCVAPGRWHSQSQEQDTVCSAPLVFTCSLQKIWYWFIMSPARGWTLRVPRTALVSGGLEWHQAFTVCWDSWRMVGAAYSACAVRAGRQHFPEAAGHPEWSETTECCSASWCALKQAMETGCTDGRHLFCLPIQSGDVECFSFAHAIFSFLLNQL